MLRHRVLSAIVLLPIVLALAYLGGIPWSLTVLIVGVLGWREMTNLLQRNHFAVDRLLGLVFIVACVGEAYIRALGLISLDLLRPLLTGLIVFSLTWALYDRSEHPTINWAINIAGALYMGFLLAHFVSLRLRPQGFNWLMLALILTWANDSMAYFVGSTLGRHKLWPRVSPKKTWEGLFGGLLGALTAGGLFAHSLVNVPAWSGVMLGLLVAIAATFGDLAVSLLKRMARLKDSSNLIPGHGGVLDRLDSLMFTVPIVTYFAGIMTGI